ncbi:MFS transporter [Cellulomonas sp. HZM]|uniref:MFS transporter n=1 Tax=Cellulomonas sp. HZM TaxID=1454010 RepID=UPI00068C79FB|nr:MFS transporter [Cellulomonas sp. HZM]
MTGRREGPLVRPAFRRLTAAWVSTNLGDSALYLMVAVWAKDLTGSDAQAALVFVVLGLPALCAPFLGQLVDRVSRRTAMIVVDLATATALLALLAVHDASRVWVLYTVTFLYGCAGYATAAAQSGLLRDMLPDQELATASGMFTTIDQALRLVSPLAGTALYVAAGPHAVVVLTASTFVVAAVVLATVRVAESRPERAEGEGYWSSLAAGVRFLRSEPVLARLTLVLAVGFGITGLSNVAIFPVLDQDLGVGASALGVVVPVQGVGAVVGGLLAARVVTRVGERATVVRGVLVLAAGMLVMLAVTLVPLPRTVALVVLAAGLAVAGLGIPWVVVGASTYRLRVTPADLQGRTSAAMNVAFNLPQTLVTLVGAGLLGVVDHRVLVAVAVVVLVAAAVVGRAPVRGESLRGSPERPAPVDGPTAQAVRG